MATDMLPPDGPILVVNLPGAPDRDLGLNGRVHWAKRHKLTRQAKHDAKYALLGQTTAAQRARLAACPVIKLFVIAPKRPVAQQMDDDNVWGCLKPHRDQIAQELGVNDRQMVCGAVKWTGHRNQTALVLAGETPTGEG